MLVPCSITAIRRSAAAALFAALTIACCAQEPPAAPTPQNTPETQPVPVLNYAQPVSHFPNPVGPYTPRHVAPPNLANTSRIDSLMHEGKVYLSLNDAIALALENNLDIAISRYNLNIADTDVLRARAGAAFLASTREPCRIRQAAALAVSVRRQELPLAGLA